MPFRLQSVSEGRFIASLSEAATVVAEQAADLQHNLQALEQWRAQLQGDLCAATLGHAGFRPDSSLARQALAIDQGVADGIRRWQQQWADLAEAQAVAAAFQGQLMLLVFGKFNAGKSSLCNFIAGRFRRAGQRAQYFHLQHGQLHDAREADARFQEGATETTSRLQGVRLGEHLVLLDTPGLHSVAAENADLTQRLIDSADGVLWLSSSTSPGQVQELDELARELHRHKPLQPVITRSDFIEEDEVDEQIVKVLRNKTAQNRAVQEADVTARACEKLRQLKLDPALLQPPVSLSVHAARECEQTPEALKAAGFERLYEALSSLAGPALAYKRRKPAEVLLHHLDENVMGDLNAQLRPSLQALYAAVQAAEAALDEDVERLKKQVWRRLAPQVPQWLDAYEAGTGLPQMSQMAEQALEARFNELAPLVLPAYDHAPLDRGCFAVDVAEALGDAVPMRSPASPELVYAALEQALQTRLQAVAVITHHSCEEALQAMSTRAQSLMHLVQARAEALGAISQQVRLSQGLDSMRAERQTVPRASLHIRRYQPPAR